MMNNFLLLFSVATLFLLFRTTDGAGPKARTFRDWKPVSHDIGWDAFNSRGEPFLVKTNTDICDREHINITLKKSVSDYSTEITSAFRTLRRRKPPGGSVILGLGIYPVNGQVNISSYCCLRGAGMDKTTIRLARNAPPFVRAGLIRSIETKHVTVANLTIDGNMFNQRTRDLDGDGYGRYGLFTQLTNYLYIYRVRAIHNLGYGLDPHGSKKHWGFYLIIDECEAIENGMDGFTIDQTMYVLLKNSVSIDNARHGINVVTGTRYLKAVGNTAKGNGKIRGPGCSVIIQNNQFKGTGYANFSDNTLLNGRKGGFCLNDVGNVIAKANTIKNNHKSAFCYHFVKTNDVLVKDSTCKAKPAKDVRVKMNAEFIYED